MTLPTETWPLPRGDRGQNTQPRQPPVVALKTPRVSVFPFYLGQATANRRSTASTRALSGPAVIRTIQFTQNGTADPPISGLELGIADIAIREEDVLLTTPKAWSTLGDYLRSDAAVVSIGGATFPGSSLGTLRQGHPTDLHILIPKSAFHLVLSLTGSTVSALTAITGHVVIAEDINVAAYERYY